MRHCGAGYAQSLAVLATAKRASNDSLLTKSSIMLGVGESGTVAVLRVLTATSTDCDHIAAAVVMWYCAERLLSLVTAANG
jgi:lipoate synthase